MPVGSPRPNAGRPKGRKNNKTLEQVQAVVASGLSPLEYLLSVMRDAGADEAKRIDAAKAAAPYVHARLQPVDGEGDSKQTIEVKGALAWQPPE